MVVLGGLSATIFAIMKRNCIIAQLKRHAKLVRIIRANVGFAKSRFANRKGIWEMQYAVYFEPYSLEPGEVGCDIYRPVLVSRHRSREAAARKLIRLIRGTDRQAMDYLRAVNNNPYSIALRYVAWQIGESGRVIGKLSARQLREGI